ncbi:nickel pincer cofactor biosynthesis protein LarC [Mobilicoccus massiliensis]|uniref:nickel pincer cofactor biosynthesis protein LarC n=1 Tax=Mobilicoccus massiliensis TaxID=1522310 RepID=UPI00058F8FEE|nr:nickel pincer cofactor biosynthesis protein LarC [Mobilicoccus massiliensis]
MGRRVWVDARVGVAGDMLLGALLDAGADLEVVRRDVEAVLPETVRLSVETVARGVMRATKLHVDTVVEDHPHRPWSDIRARLTRADLPDRVRRDVLATFSVLAEAEGRVHGIDPEDVEFHEVGAWDSIADVVGVCSALADLAVEHVLTSPIALGGGFARGAHGIMPVPVPAVLHLVENSGLVTTGVPVDTSEPVGELATPTGVALLVALARPATGLPRGAVLTVGVGAGTKDDLPWPNITRVVVFDPLADPAGGSSDGADEHAGWTQMAVLEANVDDLDPRLWPGVLADLLESGAVDAWMTPIVMKKGRPAHTVSALAESEARGAVREAMFRMTSTLGVREHSVRREALDRTWRTIGVDCAGHRGEVRLKCAHVEGRILRVTPEFDDVATLAREAGAPQIDAMTAAVGAAVAVGFVVGAALPDDG